MKVAITCDHLLGRNHYTEIIEAFCELYPDAPIYCFAHARGKILGAIEQRSIKSTYLSNIVTTEEEFYQHAHKLPSLAKNLFVSCEFDVIINVSKGFSQGLHRCETSKIVTYLYDMDLDKKINKGFVQKLFSPFVRSWVEKSLKNVNSLYVARFDLAEKCKSFKQDVEVIPPPFRIADYALFPRDMFKHHFFLVEAEGIKLSEAEKIAEWMKEWNYQFQFIGNDTHLASMKSKHPEQTFFGQKCCGEHAPVLAASKALISFNTENFPQLVLGALGTGRPVIIATELKKWVEGEGITTIDRLDKDLLKKSIEIVEAKDLEWESKKIRAHSMEYNEAKFKIQMKRILDKLEGKPQFRLKS